MVSSRRNTSVAVAAAFGLSLLVAAPAAIAQVTSFKQAVAEEAAGDSVLGEFYRTRAFEGLWIGTDQDSLARRNALLAAFADAPMHGLPADLYDPQSLIAKMQAATTPFEQGQLEAELSRLFLQYARDIQTGILTPDQVVELIHRRVPYRDQLETLNGFATAEPINFLKSLAPQSPEYARLLRAKMTLEQVIATDAWGEQVWSSNTLRPGESGTAVTALRNRLIRMGYLSRSLTPIYDDAMVEAVRDFQSAHGLTADGVAGPGTLEQINIAPEERLKSVLVAMERERWLNIDRGDRHVWVNLTDFTAKIVDHDIVTFETRSVIGARDTDRQSPEFSDEMEHMVINPTWFVPRSIIVGEYLPSLQADPTSVGHLEIVNSRGQVLDRTSADFSQFTESTFPFSMRQPPGPRNALGSVKFMFPNRYNIYLHDTPAQNLFVREVRAYSHGCIRLDDPHEFAYALLAPQVSEPVGYFQSILRTRQETQVDLNQHVPVHIDYRTAFTNADNQLEFRRDIYGRDAQIWQALARQGVAVPGVQG